MCLAVYRVLHTMLLVQLQQGAHERHDSGCIGKFITPYLVPVGTESA